MTHVPPDPGQAKIVVEIDPDLKEIVPGFLNNRQRDLITIESCLKQGDLNTIRMLGHRMKGDGGGYGFDKISTIGQGLEEAALARDFATIKEECAHLNDFLARVEVVYRN
jgi:hypothetical protein